MENTDKAFVIPLDLSWSDLAAGQLFLMQSVNEQAKWLNLKCKSAKDILPLS